MIMPRNVIPKVCLCGRPNVGKSTLFNRLIGKKKALVLDTPGVTRDVHTVRITWGKRTLELADLAGLELWSDIKNPKDELQKLATEAAIKYLKEANLVLFVMDGRSPLTPADIDIAHLIRTQGKEVLLVLAKAEGTVSEDAIAEAAELGWGEFLATSAEHNLGIEDLKEKITETLFGTAKEQEADEDISASSESVITTSMPQPAKGYTASRPLCLGVYGRPNVGKSTLVNALLGSDRMITSPIAGTTVDSIDSDFTSQGVYYRIIDTAGIRRKSNTAKGVEVLSVVQALKSLPQVDVALFMIDGYEGVTDQDEKIAGELLKAGRPLIIIINKWDLCRVDKQKYSERTRDTLRFLDFAPLIFVNAKKGEGLEPLFDLIPEILHQRTLVAPTPLLNRIVKSCERKNNPKGVKIFYSLQTSKNPPTITIQVNNPKKVHYTLERSIKNSLRAQFGWMGSPLKLVLTSKH